MRILVPLAAALGLLAAPASALSPAAAAKGEAKLEKMLAGRVAGKPVDCINQSQTTSSTVIDGTAIVYQQGGRLYVNRPSSGAESLDSDDILLTKSYSSQLCSIDIVRLIDRTTRFPNGFVGLSKFVPYTRVAAAKAD